MCTDCQLILTDNLNNKCEERQRERLVLIIDTPANKTLVTMNSHLVDHKTWGRKADEWVSKGV